jgi:mono/diheme cytochrome c family protein
MLHRNHLVTSILTALLLPGLLAACASAPTDVPTELPPPPTALQLPAAAATAAMPATRAPAAPTAAAAPGEVSGASLYQVSCAACHGADLKGSNFELDGQKISVPAITWDELTSTYSADPSRGTVVQQVALGITKGQDEKGGDLNTMMPRWSSLSQAQVDSLVQYLQSPGSAGGAVALSPEGAALSGAQLYAASCASCHGADANGLSLEKEGGKITTPSLHWSELTNTFSADPSRGTVAQQVAIAIIKGQDETGGDLNPMMPRWSFLSQAQVDGLVQYLQTTFP